MVKNKELNVLMDKVQNGDESAFEILYNETYRGVFSFVYTIVQNYQDAEDIMQDTYIKIRRYAQSYTIGGNVVAWILQIAKNLAYDFQKKNNRKINVENMDIFPIQQSMISEDNLFVYQIINKFLSLKDRQIVILHIIYGLKNKEIAKLLDIPMGTILWRYNKAMKLLREKIQEVLYEK